MKQVRVYLRFCLLVICVSKLSAHLFGQPATENQIALGLGQYQTQHFPQKLFIHFDKEHYAAGETIWFKGYLAEGKSHLPDTASANVYLELWNTQGQKVSELVVKPENGSFSGSFPIPGEFHDGNYVLRAYTDWMLNQGEDFLFYKYFYIRNSQFANAIDNDTRRFNREFNTTLENLRQTVNISFFPEGGNLVNGLDSRVAVRVCDGTFRGQRFRGSIKDDTGTVVASFETNDAGLGVFSYTPENGRTYVAELNTGGRRPVVEPLPAAKSEGVVLKADIKGDFLEIKISSSLLEKDENKYTLLAQSRGKLLFTKPELILQDQQTFQLPLNEFPTGVTQLAVLGADASTLAERLVFVNHDDQVYFDIRALMLRSGEANALSIDVLASDLEGQPLKGNFSVAVQYGKLGERSNAENIFSSLLMTSDLAGQVENPARYFDYAQEDVDLMVDMLMLTHKWKRFSWEELMNARFPEPQFKPVYGVDVFGSLVDPQDRLGVANAEVQMRLIEDLSRSHQTKTDANGSFLFSGLDLADSTMVEFIHPMLSGRRVPEVLLAPAARQDPALDAFNYIPNSNTYAQQITDRGPDWSRPRAERSGTASARGGQLFGTPDQTIYVEEKEAYTSVIELLRDKAIGLTISPSGFVSIRGVRSINYQSPPLFFVDGVESEGAFFSLHPNDIERIEIFRGASTAAFGARGANGALAAYTKRRDFQAESTPASIFQVRGFHVPMQFPVLPEKATAFDQINTTHTAFWEPNLRTNEEGLANFQFFPLPGVTQYRIVIQGVSEDGKIGYAEFVIGN